MKSIDKAKLWIKEACMYNDQKWMPTFISFNFSNKLFVSFGIAKYPNTIEISKVIWNKASEKQKRNTVMHEACHIIAWFKYGTNIKGHGKEWKECMMRCNLKPEVYHKIGVYEFREGKKRYSHIAKCSCSKVYGTKNQIDSIKNLFKSKNLSCNHCGKRIRYYHEQTNR